MEHIKFDHAVDVYINEFNCVDCGNDLGVEMQITTSNDSTYICRSQQGVICTLCLKPNEIHHASAFPGEEGYAICINEQWMFFMCIGGRLVHQGRSGNDDDVVVIEMNETQKFVHFQEGILSNQYGLETLSRYLTE